MRSIEERNYSKNMPEYKNRILCKAESLNNNKCEYIYNDT